MPPMANTKHPNICINLRIWISIAYWLGSESNADQIGQLTGQPVINLN